MAKKFADGEMGATTPSLKLSKTNYRVWSMTMEVYLDSRSMADYRRRESDEEEG